MRIEINGEPRNVADESYLSDLVNELSLTPERVAIELNKEVVRRADWATTLITEGDRIEIVQFVGGGRDAVSDRGRKPIRW
ncbi:MAG: sulfur carrier protein ThiS [Pyrinomonadaceae bacterium]